jgi:hypothetical protein
MVWFDCGEIGLAGLISLYGRLIDFCEQAALVSRTPISELRLLNDAPTLLSRRAPTELGKSLLTRGYEASAQLKIRNNPIKARRNLLLLRACHFFRALSH